MSVLIKGMDIPTTGLYFVSVDNRDKTVVTVERMLGNRDVRQIVGSFELVPVLTPHGRLIDADMIAAKLNETSKRVFGNNNVPEGSALSVVADYIEAAPTIIEAERKYNG